MFPISTAVQHTYIGQKCNEEGVNSRNIGGETVCMVRFANDIAIITESKEDLYFF